MHSAFHAGTFLKEFLRHPIQIGAVIPSSLALSDCIVHAGRVPEARSIVELGCGTGVVTERILALKKPEASFVALEINERFVNLTKERCPTATVLNVSAAKLTDYAPPGGFDAVVCGLPWAAFPDALQDELLAAVHAGLAEGGRFVTFAYLLGVPLPSGLKFRKKIRRQFAGVRATPVVWTNIPPAFVYVAEKRRHDA